MPIILDINNETISALKVHLINLIIEFRLYKDEDYNNLLALFSFKNQQVEKELVNEIFEEIVDAFNE